MDALRDAHGLGSGTSEAMQVALAHGLTPAQAAEALAKVAAERGTPFGGHVAEARRIERESRPQRIEREMVEAAQRDRIRLAADAVVSQSPAGRHPLLLATALTDDQGFGLSLTAAQQAVAEAQQRARKGTKR
jgi:hypothetical protein